MNRMSQKEFSRHLRKNMTPEERIMWEALRNRKLGGHKFRRQHPIGEFIVDFACLKHMLIIELDGSVHSEPEQKQYDNGRDAILRERGYKVLRFYNSEVSKSLKQVLAIIEEAIAQR